MKRFIYVLFLPILLTGQRFERPALLLKNEGQLRSTKPGYSPREVLYYMQTPAVDFYITEGGLTYVFKKIEADSTSTDPMSHDDNVQTTIYWHRIDVEWKNARFDVSKVEEIKDPVATVSFFNELVPEGLEHRPVYRRLVFKDVYPNVDVEFVANNDMLKYNIILHPGANVADIRMAVRGAKDLKVDSTLIEFVSAYNALTEGPLYCFTSSGKKVPVYFEKFGNNEVGLIMDKSITHLTEDVIIDPTLRWSTYFGGSGYEDGMKIVSRGSYIYAILETTSSDFPLLNESGAYYQGSFGGDKDWGIVKFNTNGQLLWSSYYGGSKKDFPKSIAIGKVGLSQWVVVAGATRSSDMPTRNPGIGNYFDGTLGGTCDAFIVLFGANDSRVWATYMGGSAAWAPSDSINETYTDVYIDTVSSSMWAVGYTLSTDFPTQSYGSYYFNGSNSGDMDVFIQRFGSNLNLMYSTYYGSSGTDNNVQLDVTPTQNKMIAFQTNSNNLPLISVDATSYQQSYVNSIDNYVAIFNANMQQIYGSYLSGSDKDFVFDVLFVDSLYFLTGATWSNNYPIANVYGFPFLKNFAGGYDVFLSAFNSKGRLVYSTCMGNSNLDNGDGLVYDKNNKYLYVVGYGQGGSGFPMVDPGGCSYYKSSSGSNTDAFIVQFDSTFKIKWSTYFGGGSSDRFRSGTVISDGTIFLTGYTNSTNFPTTNILSGSYYDNTLGGSQDAVFVAFKPCPSNFNTVTASASAVCPGQVVHLTASGGSTYTWSTGSTASAVDVVVLTDTTIIVTATNAWGCCENDTVHITAYPAPAVSVVGPDTLCASTSGTYVASGANQYTWSNGTLGATALYSYSTDGLYHENVIGQNSYGCRDTVYFDIRVLPLPSAGIQTDTILCNVDSIQVCGAGGAFYFWSVPSISIDSTVSCFTYHPSAGTTPIQLFVKDIFGCVSSTVSKVIKKTIAPNLFHGDTTYKCPEDAIVLNYAAAGSIVWNTGDTGPSIQVSQAGVYSLILRDSLGCAYKDSVHVVNFTVVSVQITLHPSGFCNNAAPYNFTADSVGGTWAGPGIVDASTGKFDPTTLTPGLYTIIYIYEDSHHCEASDTTVVEIYAVPQVQIAQHPSGLCNNADAYYFSANYPGGSWSGAGIVDSSMGKFDPTILAPGTYKVIYCYEDVHQCKASDTTTIEVYDVPIINAEATKESCQGANDGVITITATHGTTPYTYFLNSSMVSSIISNLAPGTYEVYVVDYNQCKSTEKFVEVLSGDFPCNMQDVYIPNVFSPNGDQQNDVFTVYSKFIVSMHLVVYDRYGEKVFETNDPNEGWDGTYKGQPVEEGVYMYYLTAKLSNGVFVKRTGSVQLVR